MTEQKEKEDSQIYFTRELLVLSNEGWFVELLTITGLSHQTGTRDLRLKGLFPKPPKEFASQFSTERPWKFNKPTIFFTCWVHPGEIPASHVCNGIIKFLLDHKDE